MVMESVYHAPTFEPTVDELGVLKRMEMGETMSMTSALREHLSVRLLEWGMIGKTVDGRFTLTDSGRRIIRRSDS